MRITVRFSQKSELISGETNRLCATQAACETGKQALLVRLKIFRANYYYYNFTKIDNL
jgi:hypothetical protein